MNCLLWVNPNNPLVSYENGFISVLSNHVPIVAVLSALAAVVLKVIQVVLHRVADLSFRVVGIKEEFRARLEATHPPVAFRIEQIEIGLEEQ